MDLTSTVSLAAFLAGILVSIFIASLVSYFLFKARSSKEIADLRVESETERSRLQAELGNSHKALEEKKDSISALQSEISSLNERMIVLNSEKASVEANLKNEKTNAEEKIVFLNDAQRNLADAFAALARKALDQNSSSFVRHATDVLANYQSQAQLDLQTRQEKIAELVTPVQKSLEKVDLHIAEMEKHQAGTFATLDEQLKTFAAGQRQLSETTSHLVGVLKNSKTRGQWGELQLRRAVELAGMTSYCDFSEQESVTSAAGRQRPDMIVRLPAERTIVVDAKVPMDSYFAAFDAADDEARKYLFSKHAKTIRDHITLLGRKTYFVNFERSPEFVLMFLPNEAVYSVALEYDPAIIDFGATNNVIVATPVTLIALLKASAYGWRQEKLATEVKQISILGRHLFERLKKMTHYISKVGDSLDKSVKSYNSMIGTLEGRVLPSVRKLSALESIGGRGSGEIEDPLPIETVTREIQAGELKDIDSAVNAVVIGRDD